MIVPFVLRLVLMLSQNLFSVKSNVTHCKLQEEIIAYPPPNAMLIGVTKSMDI